MKKLISLLTLVVFVTLHTSCSDENLKIEKIDGFWKEKIVKSDFIKLYLLDANTTVFHK